MPQATETASRLDSLTGMRFFAAFLVFGFHALHYGDAPGLGFFGAGMTGVSFFYIVSGFVLAWSARSGTTALVFYGRRFARIYPAYIGAWVVALVLLVVTGAGLSGVDLLPPTLLQAWVPDEDAYFATNAVFWSLSVEAFFYAMFPFIFPVLARRGRASLTGICAACVGATWAVAVIADQFKGDDTRLWAMAIFPPTRLPEFVLGMALALLVRQGFRVPVSLWWPALLSVGAVGLAGVVPDAYSRVAVTVVPFALLVYAGAVTDIAGRATVLRSRTLVELGVWSYAFYLIHTQVLAVCAEAATRLGHPPADLDTPARLIWWVGALGASILASYLLHALVERPAERRLRPRPRPSVTTQ
ncbi:acyltransferase family protein [Nocardioides houyundeii]|uniref:acyltransferase family protein n=1 Tax=Nocardioides houyundeii TaxID=2045452 RepID=UPI000C75C969|nr:acyltransferase [Nocardioides houyundeii]